MLVQYNGDDIARNIDRLTNLTTKVTTNQLIKHDILKINYCISILFIINLF